MTELDDIENNITELVETRNKLLADKKEIEKQISNFNEEIKLGLQKRRRYMKENSGS